MRPSRSPKRTMASPCRARGRAGSLIDFASSAIRAAGLPRPLSARAANSIRYGHKSRPPYRPCRSAAAACESNRATCRRTPGRWRPLPARGRSPADCGKALRTGRGTALLRRLAGPILGLAAENLQAHAQIEPQPLVFRFLNDERLKRREVVGQRLIAGPSTPSCRSSPSRKSIASGSLVVASTSSRTEANTSCAGTFASSRSPRRERNGPARRTPRGPEGANGEAFCSLCMAYFIRNAKWTRSRPRRVGRVPIAT